jgi:galactonate dehydratase
MKITRLETLRLGEFPNLVWLRVHTDQGLTGLGETSYAAQSVEAYLHEYVAPRVLGEDPREIDRLTRGLTGYRGFRGAGVETRAGVGCELLPELWKRRDAHVRVSSG